MKTNKGSAAIAILAIIVVVLAVAGGYYYMVNHVDVTYMPENNAENNFEQTTNEAKTQAQPSSNTKSWITTATGGNLAYDSSWKVDPWKYVSPGQAAQGVKESVVGYKFTLSSGAQIFWGGPQSSCGKNEFGTFQSGTSTTACVKSTRADLSANATQEDKNAFGDFVKNNQ